MAGENVCKNNKFGFCKFKDTCRFHHINTICDTIKCDIQFCEKRHPRKCKYFDKYSRCKFGIFCKYSHVTLSKNSETGHTSNIELDMEIIELKKKNEEMKKEIDLIKSDICQIIRENSEMKKVIEFLKQNKTEEIDFISNDKKNKGDKDFKCDECNFKGKNGNGLKVHKSLKHKNIIQADGNDDTDLKKETIKFKIKMDVSPECNYDDITESIESNYIGALEDNNIFDDECKNIVIESANDEDSEMRIKYYISEVKNSSDAIKALRNQFDPINYDDLCFSKSVRGQVKIDCINIEEIHFN